MHKLILIQSLGLNSLSNTAQKVLLSVLLLSHISIFSQLQDSKNSPYRDSIVKYWYTDSTRAKFFIEEYISISRQHNEAKQLFKAYHAMAAFYYERMDTLKIIECTDTLMAIAKRNNLKIETLKAYHLKNNTLIMTEGFGNQAIFDNIYKALKISRQLKSTVWECKFYDDLAEYYEISGDFEQAVNYHKKNLLLLQRISNSEDYAKYKIWGGSIEKTYLELSDIYIDLKDVDAAITYMHLATNVLDSTEGNYHDDYRLRNKINELEINLLDNKTKLAKENLKEALKLIPGHYKQAFSDYTKNYYYGLISYQEGNFHKAIDYLSAIDSLRINAEERMGLFRNDYYKTLYKSYLKVNDLEKADYYFEKHLASIQGQMDINNKVNSNFKELEVSQYNEEVEALKKEGSKQHFVLLSLSVTTLLLTVLAVILFKRKQKKEKEKLDLLLEQISSKMTQKNSMSYSLRINDIEMDRIISEINKLEDDKYYLKNDCTLSNLAKKLKTNTTYLSKIFNTHYQKRFNTYINDLRIDFIIEKLNSDNQFRNYTIKSLANEVGFKSKESFNSAFKKRTGVLPSQLIKELSKQKDRYLGAR